MSEINVTPAMIDQALSSTVRIIRLPQSRMTTRTVAVATMKR
jgi:hypothetical protein